MSEGAFFQDLAMLMAVAGLTSVLFARLNWPKAIGYILAGVLLSPHVWHGSALADVSSVQTIGQLGIVFLMFTMGLGLSTSTLKRVGHVALPTAMLDTVVMVALGYTIGRRCFGWETVPSLFLGAAICDSATTLLAKVIDELNWGRRSFVRYVLGTSVCEDIVCVGVIALITGFANGGGMSFAALGRSLGGLALFFVATLFFGLVFVPRFLTLIATRRDDETLLLALLGCCFFVSYVAYRLDFSLALGAFLIGVVGAGSDVRARLARLVEPLRSMFAAVFFVSVGLLVDPAACWHHLPAILLLTAVVMLGKFTNCTFGAVASGLELKTAVQMGLSLAQIGEFAFMVALLYVTVTGDFSKPMYPIVVGVSILTTVLNPLMIRLSDRAGTWVESACPVRVRKVLDGYRGFLARYRETEGDAKHAAVRHQFGALVFCWALSVAVAMAVSLLNGRDWSRLSVFFEAHKRIFFCLAMNVVLVSMLAIVLRQARALANGVTDILVGSGEARWQLAVRHVTRFTTLALVVGLAFLQITIININLAPTEWWARCVVAGVLLAAALFGWRFFAKAGRDAAASFSEALRTDERLARISREVTFSLPEDPVGSLVVPALSPAIGVTIGVLNIRAKTGAIVVDVEREGEKIRHVGPEFSFLAGDSLTVIGDGGQIAALKDLLGVVA